MFKTKSQSRVERIMKMECFKLKRYFQGLQGNKDFEFRSVFIKLNATKEKINFSEETSI